MHYHYWFDLHELICTKFKINNWKHPKDLHLKTWTYVWVIKKSDHQKMKATVKISKNGLK